MAESIIKVPLNADSKDYDFLAFSFNGKHSYDDFGIYRVSDGDRYNTDLIPQMNDKTVDNVGSDGMFFFGTTHKQRDFNINFAFDHMDDATLRAMKQWLNGKEIHDLWFDEEPYKVYSAKVTSTATIKHVTFEENGKRIYKGEGSIQFTAYWPYAHTPDYIMVEVFDLKKSVVERFDTPVKGQYFHIEWIKSVKGADLFFHLVNSDTVQEVRNVGNFIEFEQEIEFESIHANADVRFKIYSTNDNDSSSERRIISRLFDGKKLDSYNIVKNKDWWSASNVLENNDQTCTGENPGDIETPFVLKYNSINSQTTFAVGDLAITIPATAENPLSNIIWDSKTGIVSAKIGNSTENVPISYTGNSLGGIPVDGVGTRWGRRYGNSPNYTYNTSGITLNYHYWYY